MTTTTPSTGLFIDIGQNALQAVSAGETFEYPLERGENGRLTDHCRERLTAGLRGFLGRKGRSSQTAWCAVGARGVSMRRMSLPSASKDEFQRVLRLQIESEFPLSPDDLAWGWRPVGAPKSPANGGPPRQEVFVVAVKKQTLEEYATLLRGCGVNPIFTLTALARAEVHPPRVSQCALLHLGRTHSELLTFDHGAPATIRLIPWGGENVTRAIQEKLSVGHDEAEKLKLAQDQPGVAAGPQGLALQTASASALAPLAAILKSSGAGEKIYLTGKSARGQRLPALLAAALGGGIACESLEPTTAGATPVSPSLAGLQKSTAPLVLALDSVPVAARPTRSSAWPWAALAACLALGAILFPYGEAIIRKPALEKELAALQSDRGRLATIDQELEFLRSLKTNQPPYLDAIYLLARSAPSGAHFDGVSMGRHQQVSLRVKMASPQEVTDFRNKLIVSGWFANIVVEEQTPGQDRQVTVRMTADLLPADLRKPLGPDTDKNGKSSSSSRSPMMMSSEPMGMMPPPDAAMPRPRHGQPKPPPGGAAPPMPMPVGLPPGATMTIMPGGDPGDGDDETPHL